MVARKKIKASKGRTIVVKKHLRSPGPKANVESLLDHIEELQAQLAFQRSRDEESLPMEAVEKMLSGVSPIRVWREQRNMTLDELASAVGKSKGYLSEIETGKKNGSISVVRSIANCLNVEMDDLV